MSTTANSPSATQAASRSPVERTLVWGGILVLLALVGLEYMSQRSFQQSYNALTDALETSEKDTKAQKYITNLDVRRLLGGKEPEFSGHPGQIQVNSNFYEAYVWRSLLKRKFIAPPKEPEILDQFAIFSGEVRPENVKYRTPDLDKNRGNQPSFFDAHVLYVYYGSEDPKTKTRELIHAVPEREKYFDDVLKLPDAEELKRRHEANLARSIADRQKFGPKLTPEQIDAMDAWKHPELVNGRGGSTTPGKESQPQKTPDVPEKKDQPSAVPANPVPASTGDAGGRKDPDVKKPAEQSPPTKAAVKEGPAPEATPAKPEATPPAKKPEEVKKPEEKKSEAKKPEDKKPDEKKADEKK